MSVCPVCMAAVTLGEKLSKGQSLGCEICGSHLKVHDINPIRLEEVQEEEFV